MLDLERGPPSLAACIVMQRITRCLQEITKARPEGSSPLLPLPPSVARSVGKGLPQTSVMKTDVALKSLEFNIPVAPY